MKVKGLNHITLSVNDLPASLDFYTKVLELSRAAQWPGGAYLTEGDFWIALVLDREACLPPSSGHTHFAFTVERADFSGLAEKIIASGAGVWRENQSEGDSLYFLDPAGHRLEIHCGDLDTRLADARQHPWEGLEIFREDARR